MESNEYDLGMIFVLLFVSFLLLFIVVVSIPQQQQQPQQPQQPQQHQDSEAKLLEEVGAIAPALVPHLAQRPGKRRIVESGDPV